VRDGDAGLFQALPVGFAFVAEWIELRGEDEGGWKMGEMGGEQR
jgi:hypothetical protein